ncbi:MAG TPA: PVC-type heme-binding CxxCH protein, partial [Isosphaeraceae bacterium]
DMHSRHEGQFWVGSYEGHGDRPRGTLTSAPFVVRRPFASFLVGGGAFPTTRVELVRADTKQVIDRVSGAGTEDMRRVAVDLTPHRGREIIIRLVDDHGGGWGHVNFDDFRLHDTLPAVPPRPRPPTSDAYAHAGLAPEEAAWAMTVPEGFRVSLFAGEPDVVQPIALALDDRGRLWVAEAYSYPVRVPAEKAKDRILIFEDTDNDGRFDKRIVFADRLNLVSGLEVGFGGVWVGAAPELLFFPDRDGDDRPDGPPQVLLDGWGQHDTHETLNSFCWGPDGWLYGCHGVFTHSLVGQPGTPESRRTPINAGIWRYHPTTRSFEVFAHGTSNPWGIDFDARGQAFLTSCVIPHLFHVVQGARYQRQAGPHFNPYTYDDIKTIADHRHYLGANPHGGNGRSDAAGGGHAHAGALIYQGDAWPPEYRGSIFMNNIHGARLNRDTLTPRGSGFVGGHAPDFLLANDSWSQVVSLRAGPDGNVYMIDWYDKNQCHATDPNVHDRTNGRIFKISYGGPRPTLADRLGQADLNALDGRALVGLLDSENDWLARHARRILQERRPDPGIRAMLGRLAFSDPGFSRPEPLRLRALWALHGHGGLDEEHVARGLADDSPDVRAWTIQLALEDRTPSSALLTKLGALAGSDPSPVVRLYLASALQRLPLADRWGILEGVVGHGEDAEDHNLPLMYWYAAEPLAELDAGRAARLAAGARIPNLLPWMSRRIAAIGSAETIALLVDELGATRRPAQRLSLLHGINEALAGRRRVAMPTAWPVVSEALLRDPDPQVRAQAAALGVTFGAASARDATRRVVADVRASVAARLDALGALLKARDPDLPPTLHVLVADPALGSAALRGLAAYGDPRTPAVILDAYAGLGPSERRDALATLTARVEFARALLAAVEAGRVPRAELTADLVRQLHNLKDPALAAQIDRAWGSSRQPTPDRARLIALWTATLAAPP